MSYEEVMDVVLPRQRQQSPHITGHYGEYRANGPHGGSDFNYDGGQTGINLTHPTIHSPVSGVVTFVGGEFGTVKIRDADGNSHEILHTDAQLVAVGQAVVVGDSIGTMGGRGPHGATQYAQHVHYQMKDSQGRPVNPETYWNEHTAAVATTTQPGTALRDQKSLSSQPLTLGSNGAAVLSLQQQLTDLGYSQSDGQSLRPDGHFGPNTRSALETFQRDNHLAADGIAGPKTKYALDKATRQQQASLEGRPMPALTHPSHVAYPMFQQCLSGIGNINADHGVSPSSRDERIAAALAVEATARGLNRVDQVLLNDDASRVFAAQGKPQSIEHRFASVDTMTAINTSLEQSNAQWPQAAQEGQQRNAVWTEQQTLQLNQQNQATGSKH